MKPDGLICYNPWDPQSARIYGTGGVYHSICANAKNSGLIRDGIVYAVSMDGKSKPDAAADISGTLTVPDRQSKIMAVVYDNRSNKRGVIEMFENHSHDSRYTGPLKVAQTVSQQFGTGGNNTPLIVEALDEMQRV